MAAPKLKIDGREVMAAISGEATGEALQLAQAVAAELVAARPDTRGYVHARSTASTESGSSQWAGTRAAAVVIINVKGVHALQAKRGWVTKAVSRAGGRFGRTGKPGR